MTTFAIPNAPPTLHAQNITKNHRHRSKHSFPPIKGSLLYPQNGTNRRQMVTTLLATSISLVVHQLHAPIAVAENWGTHSFIFERYFRPDLSPEDAVARIKQTADGLHNMRDMLENMSWRYVIFYIRLKQAYLDKDLKNAMTTLPKGRWNDYVKTANELVENMAQFDYYVRTPKVYESYLYYEKTLKSLDAIVDMLA